MKRILSILFSLLIILSGIHFTIATHYCGGEVAAVKLSVSGEKATCGMEADKNNIFSKEIQIESKCCNDEISIYTVDNNYSPSSFQIKAFSQNVLQSFIFPVNVSFQFLNLSNYFLADFGPPEINIVSTMSLAEICIFRI